MLYAALLAKIYRVYAVFHSALTLQRLNKATISSTRLFKIVAMVVSVDLILLTAWTIISPMKFERVPETVFEVALNETIVLVSKGSCSSKDSSLFIGLIAGYHILILVFAAYLGQKSSSLHSAFSEGKYLRWGIMSGLQFSIATIPIIVLTTDPSTIMLARGSLIALHDFALVCVLFMPKFYMIAFGVGGDNGKLLFVTSFLC